MSQVDVIDGSQLQVLVGNGASPEAFAAKCMINTDRSISFVADTQQDDIPDCEAPEDPAWKATTVTTLGCTISGSGFLDVQGMSFWSAWFFSGLPKNIKFKANKTGGEVYAGSFVLTKYEPSGSRKKKSTVTVELVADGPVTAATVS